MAATYWAICLRAGVARCDGLLIIGHHGGRLETNAGPEALRSQEMNE